jgi:hypothetical protein
VLDFHVFSLLIKRRQINLAANIWTFYPSTPPLSKFLLSFFDPLSRLGGGRPEIASEKWPGSADTIPEFGNGTCPAGNCPGFGELLQKI